jgi:hypothetical protein
MAHPAAPRPLPSLHPMWLRSGARLRATPVAPRRCFRTLRPIRWPISARCLPLAPADGPLAAPPLKPDVRFTIAAPLHPSGVLSV